MNVASLELCQELYEQSGWRNTTYWWRLHKPSGRNKLYTFDEMDRDNFQFRNHPEGPRFRQENDFFPAYDLGYLLPKLPRMNEEYWLTIQPVVYPQWCASYDRNDGISTKFESFADVPEDAAAKLAIELFKQGILTKDGDRE